MGVAGIPLLLGTSIQELRRAFPNAPSFQPGGGLSGVQSQSLSGTGQMPGEAPLPQTGSNAQGADLGDVPPGPRVCAVPDKGATAGLPKVSMKPGLSRPRSAQGSSETGSRPASRASRRRGEDRVV